MIQQIMIPLAAFAVTATGVSAFNGDLLKKLDLNLPDDQVSALEEAHELRFDGASRDEVHAILEDAGIDREVMYEVRDAMHTYRDEMRDKVHTALEAEDYGAFREAVAGTPLGEAVDTEAAFARFLNAFNLRQAGDHEGAREIMDSLGLERPMGPGYMHRMGIQGPLGDRDGDGFGHRNGGGDKSNQRGGGRGNS